METKEVRIRLTKNVWLPAYQPLVSMVYSQELHKPGTEFVGIENDRGYEIRLKNGTSKTIPHNSIELIP